MSKNRDRIIQSALSLFSEKNFEDVTIKDICQKAEMANSTFYYHFKTKEELMDCLRMHDMRPRNRELFALAATHDLMERVLVTCTMCAQRAERSGWMLTAQYYKRPAEPGKRIRGLEGAVCPGTPDGARSSSGMHRRRG